MSDFLPNDVLIDVLARLPVKTVVRCACVCKSWYSLVTNPSFITTHLNRSSAANNNHLPIQIRTINYRTLKHYSLLRCENEMLCDYAELEFPLDVSIDPYLSTIHSCNGIVCIISRDWVSQQEMDIYLWNPSIHKVIALPPVTDAYMCDIGFGFDSETEDYKVVRIVYFNGPNFDQNPSQVEIFSLSTGTWRNISHLNLPYIICKDASQAYVNGAAHWLAWDMSGGNVLVLIVSFHMVDEVFGEIMLPNSDDDWVNNVRVANFQESLSLICVDVGIRGEHTCVIWVMNEYGISKSWTKQYNIDMNGGFNSDLGIRFLSVAGFTKKGEVLFLTSFGRFVAYDPKTKQKLVCTPIGRCTDVWYCVDLFYGDTFTESLVLFGAKCRDTITSMKSPVLQGEASGGKKSRKRRDKPKKKGKKRQDA